MLLNQSDRNQTLLAQFLAQQGDRTVGTISYTELESAIARPQAPQLALLDITGNDPQIWGYCQQLQDRHTPVVIVAAQQSAILQRESLIHGANRVLIKLLVQDVLLHIIHSLLEA